ncbi:hypothetical protein CTZ27_33840 [Streptomyces griseocarneus]|nr:hypothetical protein CTZ27_33840 [Streptomyces griseocarneus]
MLLTAVTAALLLCAVWFVPSARAQSAPATADGNAADSARLADSGSVDTTPYVCGGVAFLAAGGALVTVAARRARAH